MKKPVLATIVSLLLLLVLLAAVNVIAGAVKFRADITADRTHTLSDGTRQILSRIPTPVQLRLYVATTEGQVPPFLKNYVSRVEDLLDEMARASGGKLQIEKLEPLPDSDAQDSARLDGIQPGPLPNGNALYLGLSASMLDKKVALPFLAPNRERLLEYDIARAISRLVEEQPPKIGVMSPLPVFGQPMAMMMMGGQRGPQAWVLIDELRRDFDVREIPMTAPEIPADISVLVLIHPKGITPAAEYEIDQFLLRGGKMVAFVDPYFVLDSGMGGMGGMGAMGGGISSSTLPTLLPAWGVSFDDTKVVADLAFAGETREGRSPGLLDLTADAMNPDDVLTAGLDNMVLVFAGALSANTTAGLASDFLFRTSTDSELVEPMLPRMAPGEVIKNFKPSGTQMPLGLRLRGKFPSAFPGGPPEGTTAKPGALKEAAAESTVLLVADADFIQDAIAVSEVRGLMPGQRMVVPTNGNLAFAQSALDQLGGDPSLIAVRSRAVQNRPFTVVRKMQAAAEQKFQETIRTLEASLQETEQRINALQAVKPDGKQLILSPEQQKEIEAFRATEADVKRRLKETRKQLRAEIDTLETRLKWINIAAIPAIVIVAGIAIALLRRKVPSKR